MAPRVQHLLQLLVVLPFLGGACNCQSNAGQKGGGTGATNGGSATGGSGGTSGGAFGDLYFAPAAQTLSLDGSGPQSASYTLEFKDDAGNTSQVLADSVAFNRPDLATVTDTEPVVATAPSGAGSYGGAGTIQAVYQGLTATATLTVDVQVVDYGPGLSASTPAVGELGDGGLPQDPAAGISPLLYPYDGTVWPLGLTSPLLMWNAPQAGDVYRLNYVEANYSFDGYYTLASLPGQLRLDQADWDRITASNGAASGPDPLKFTLSRWDAPTQKAYQTSTQTWTIAPASLQGAIYYWTVTNDGGTENGHITRFQPGSGAQPQVLNSGTCMGCHAVSANGNVLVADLDTSPSETPGATNTAPSLGPYGGPFGSRPWAAFDLSNAADAGAVLTLTTTKYGADLAITPDGTYAVFGGPTTVPTGGGQVVSPPIAGSKYISLGEVATGNVVATSGLDQIDVDSNMWMMMPAFSPDGTLLAVVEAQEQGADGDNISGENVLPAATDSNASEYIATLTFDEAGPTFGSTLTKVVDGNDPAFSSSGSGLGYPSFTPDSAAIAFHAGTYTTGCNTSCDDSTVDDGNLFMASLPSGPPVRLAAACDPPNAADDNASIEPTFNPRERGGYAWVVFTSMRTWGSMPWPSDVTSTQHVNGKRRLWAAAIDLDGGTVDPSHPAFYLEGQEDRPNMRGFWTLAPCIASPTIAGEANETGSDGGAPCTQGFQCCSGFCINGQCVGVGLASCAGIGSACAAASDCCNAPPVICQSGTCQYSFK